MRSRALKIALITAATIGLAMGTANATYIDIGGNYSIIDSGTDGILDTIEFSNGSVVDYSPTPDGEISDSNTVEIADIILTGYDYSTQSITTGSITTVIDTFSFATTDYEDGFQIYGDGGSLLLEANLSVENLIVVNGSNADFSSSISFNLTEIETFGSSDILDAFLVPINEGSLILSIQLNGDTTQAILNNTEIDYNVTGTSATFDGKVSPVPEPAATFLFSIGAAGFAGVIRKKRLQK